MIDKIFSVILTMFTVTLGMWVVLGSLWLVFYIDEIMKKITEI